MEDPSQIPLATLAQVRRYFMLCTRGEHFGDGYIAEEFEKGRMRAFLLRLRGLRAEMDHPIGTAGKASLHLAGEYYVAAELHRRGIHATITYGNAKSADVLAFNLEGDRFARVEVKSSRPANRTVLAWVGLLDGFVLSRSQFWVLCVVPNVGDEQHGPRYFVYDSTEMWAMVQAKSTEYATKREVAGNPSEWMWKFTIPAMESSRAEGAWYKIIHYLGQ